ncbi:MAG: hypothetical protein ABSB95_05285 [Dissulfurispiraceae bacterium]|jgi:hypothetical protein
MKKGLALLAVIIFAGGLVVISARYFGVANKKGAIPSQSFIFTPNKMEGVSIKKHFGDAIVTIDAAILKPRMLMPGNFLTMILSEDTDYSWRLRNVKFHLTEHSKDLLIEGPEALANTEFTALAIKKQSVLSNKGYTINPNADCIQIKISGNKVEVLS